MRALRRLTLLGLALVTAGVVAAPPVSAAEAPTLAALGDSYSSGEANPPFDPAAPLCDRSADAWPLLAAARLGWTATNLACSGAKTTDVVNPYKNQPAQVDALAALPTPPDVVTITIGGNDAGFSRVLGECVARDCVESGAVKAAETTIVTVLPDRLLDTYRAVEKAAPGAELVVVGYPRLFPRRQGAVTGCAWLTDSERQALNRAAVLLNLEIRIAAWRAGARYVDVTNALNGHELCTQNSWVFPIGVGDQPQYWAHPTLPGQKAIARRVAAALR